jgi:hypothetical protein
VRAVCKVIKRVIFQGPMTASALGSRRNEHDRGECSFWHQTKDLLRESLCCMKGLQRPLLAIGIYTTLSMHSIIYDEYWPLFAQQPGSHSNQGTLFVASGLGFTLSTTGTFVSVANIVALIAQIGLGCLGSRTRRPHNAVWMRRCHELCAIVYLVTPFLPLLSSYSVAQKTATLVLLLSKNMASMLAFPLACALLADLSPPGRQGAVQGVASATAHLARAGAYVGIAQLAQLGRERELGVLNWWVLSIGATGACLPLCFLM